MSDNSASERKKRSDAGKKRLFYDSSRRKELAALRALKRSKDELPRLKRTRAERQAMRRHAVIPKDRTCPVCREIKLKSRQWVVLKDGIVIDEERPTKINAVCLKCYRTLDINP